MKLFLFTKINPYIFLLFFSIGIFIVYIRETPKKIIVRHPRPDNQEVVYEDDNNNCYKYKAIEVNCPKDKSLILDHPLLID